MTNESRMAIREFKLSDLPDVIEVDVASYLQQYDGDTETSRAQIEHELEAREAGYDDLAAGTDQARVLLDGGQRIVGYAQYGADSTGRIVIKRIYLLPEFQDQGLGTRLISESIGTIRDRFRGPIYIDVWHENSRAQHVYQSLGFRPTGVRLPFIAKNGDEAGYDIEMVLDG